MEGGVQEAWSDDEPGKDRSDVGWTGAKARMKVEGVVTDRNYQKLKGKSQERV